MLWRARFRRWLEGWLPPATDAGVVAAPAPPAESSPGRRRPKPVDHRAIRLALQGGGAHGAFTWGVLDRLLDEPGLTMPHVTGTSAGALNGALLAAGFAQGGRAGAQKALADLWEGIGEIGALMAPLHVQQRMTNGMRLPGAEMVSAMMRLWSPAQLNPFDINPLRDLLVRIVDVEALRASSIRLHVAATHVETGEARLFTGKNLSIDALMASTCLPFLYQAVTIDGAAYWDGGYSANPPIGPLFAGVADEAVEILLVQINPEHRVAVPSTASDIVDRVNEITFNASLLNELRAFELYRDRCLQGGAASDDLPVLHRIALHDEVDDATPRSKTSLDAAFHRALRDHGRRAAERWLTGTSPSSPP